MRRPRFAVHAALLIVCTFLLTTLLHAQYRGSIRGTVTDSTGAMVPGATVTLLNTDTNLAMTATSDEFGIYVFNALPAAHYKVTVERSGFKKKVLESVQIIPDQLNELNLQLEIGDVQQTVDVTATTDTTDTETATVSGTLRTKEIDTMPAVGRNVFMLLQLAPGITGDNSQGNSGGGNNMPGNAGPGNPGVSPGVNAGIFATENGPQATAGGLGYQHNGISIDGISTTSAVWGGTSVITPSEDAVAEVKVISDSYDAENGRFAAAQIQVTSRSGANQPHGSFFFTAHRPGLDAYQRANTRGATTLRDNTFFDQFGGSLGAPIWKNKVFGFFNWETARSPATATTYSNAWMETTAFQALTPAGPIAAQYLSFPGSIPSKATIENISCAQAGLTAAYCIQVPGAGLNIGSPLTTGPGTQDPNWISPSSPGVGGGLNPSGPADIAEYSVPQNYTQSMNQYIGRVDAYLTPKDRLAGSIYWVPQSNTTSGLRAYDLAHHSQVNDAFSLIWNRVISATFVNEARANAAGWRWNDIKNNPQMPLGLPADGFANNGVNNFGSVSMTTFGPNVPSWLDQWTYTFKDVATKVLGRHTIKFGGELTRLSYLQDCYGCALPSYTFLNMWDFLNDYPYIEAATANPTTGVPTTERQDQREYLWGFFVQDDYKVRSNLTVNLGLRWSYFAPLYSKENNMYRAVPGTGPAFLTGLNVIKENAWNAQKSNFSPEIGFAWSPNQFGGKLVFRGGFGINYNQEEIAISANISSNPGLYLGETLSSPAPGPANTSIVYATASNLHSLNYPANPAFISPLGANGLPTTGSAQLFIFPQTMPTTRVEHWSANMQYELLPRWTASLGYQGSHSSNVIANAQIGQYAAANGAALNPNIQYNSWDNYWNASGYGNYNAMIAEVKSSSWRGLLFDTQFTWARALDTNTSPYEEQIYPYSGSLNYGPSDNNIAHAWKFYGAYSPKFFSGQPGWVEKIAGGWTITGIFNIHSGFPWTPEYPMPAVQVPTPTGPVGEGQALYCASCWSSSLYPVAASGEGTSTSNSAYETGSNFGGASGNHLSYFTLPNNYSGTGAYSNSYYCNPNTGVCPYGNVLPPAGMMRNWITGPGYKSLDATLTKAFGLPKMPVLGEGAKLQFRVDAYNLFNNLNLSSGNSGIDRNITDTTFGTSNNALGARVVTLGARFEF